MRPPTAKGRFAVYPLHHTPAKQDWNLRRERSDFRAVQAPRDTCHLPRHSAADDCSLSADAPSPLGRKSVYNNNNNNENVALNCRYLRHFQSHRQRSAGSARRADRDSLAAIREQRLRSAISPATSHQGSCRTPAPARHPLKRKGSRSYAASRTVKPHIRYLCLHQESTLGTSIYKHACNSCVLSACIGRNAKPTREEQQRNSEAIAEKMPAVEHEEIPKQAKGTQKQHSKEEHG